VVVERGYPVVAVVNSFVARGKSGILCGSPNHGASERISSDDAVYVSSSNSRVHNGVCSLDSEGCAVDGKSVSV